MVSTPHLIIIVVYAACVPLLLAVLGIGYYLYRLRRTRNPSKTGETRYGWYPGFTRLTASNLCSGPSSGAYPASCTVELLLTTNTTTTGELDEDILLFVRRTDLPGPGSSGPSALPPRSQVLGNDEFYHDAFLRYDCPLTFSIPGRYYIHAYTVNGSRKEVGAVHLFVFDVTAAPAPAAVTQEELLLRRNRELELLVDQQRRQASLAVVQQQRHRHRRSTTSSCASSSIPPPAPQQQLPTASATLAPRILPATGDITTHIPVTIHPHVASTTADQIRYSIDGSHPSLLYTSPFTLSAGRVVVRAIATSAASSPSPVVEAHLNVTPYGASYADPSIPAPTLQIEGRDAVLYFDTQLLPADGSIYYYCAALDLLRRDPNFHASFHPERCQTYAGKPISIASSIARIYAWTVVAGRHSRCVLYDAHAGTSPAVMAMERQLSPYSPYADAIDVHIPPPVMCVSCSELDFSFDEPPAGSQIAYTLNRTEPALVDVSPPACAASAASLPREMREGSALYLPGDSQGMHTHTYHSGGKVRLSLLEAEGMYVTARIFIPIFSEGNDYHRSASEPGVGGGGGRVIGYRYGAVFHRGFHFSDQDARVMLTTPSPSLSREPERKVAAGVGGRSFSPAPSPPPLRGK